MKIFDFRSDTVTLPTKAMMTAMADAQLGDSARGDDPTVNALEELSARLTGKDDALFVPSGAMANLSSLIAHRCHGHEVIVDAAAHILNSEGGGLAVVAGAVPRPVESRNGVLDPEDIGRAVRGNDNPAVAPTKLICLENTHNAAGGVVVPLERMAAIKALAARNRLSVHLDGARLFNAGAYLDVPIEAICRHVDSVWFALCKGLGCPVGAVLAGNQEFMQRARRAAKMLGGGMRQAGILAAPALVALNDPYPIHRRDHELARKLAVGLAGIDQSLVNLDLVQTNIVNCYVHAVTDDASKIVSALTSRSVLALRKENRIRFVTHYGIDDEAVEAAISAFKDAIAPGGRLQR